MGLTSRTGWAASALALTACSLLVPVDDLEGHPQPAAGDAGSTEEGGGANEEGGANGGGNDGGAEADAGVCPAAPAEPGLVGWYPFDEGEGSLVHDCAGGHHGVILEAAEGGSWTAGRSGSALRFDDANGCVSLGAVPEFRLAASGFTVAAWVRVASFGSTSDYVIGKTTDEKAGWRLSAKSPNDFQLRLGLGDAGALSVEASSVPLYAWTHVAAVYVPGTRAEVYVNGLRAASEPNPPSMVEDELANVTIGCRADEGYVFHGEIDDVRIYARGLSEVEIAELFQRP